MRVIDSGLRPVLADDTSTVVWTWLTGPYPTASLQYVRPDLWLSARTALKARVAVQFSDDGVTWTDSEKELFATYVSTDGWNYGSAWSDLFNLTSTTPRNYVRIGVQALTTTGTKVESAQARIRLHLRPLVAQVLEAGPARVNSGGSTSNWTFVPLTPVIESATVEEARGTFEVFGRSAQAKVKLGYRETDVPDDPTQWTAAGELDGTTLTTNTTSHGTDFTSLSPTKANIQFGAMVQNVTGSEIEAAMVSARIDVRRTC